jgi:hypothetical protein
MNLMRSRPHPAGSAGVLGLAFLALGASLLVTNLIGLWLASRASVLGALVLGSWPLLLLAAGLVLVGYSAARRGWRPAAGGSHER